MKTALFLSGAAAALYVSPAAREWLGSLLIMLGFELVEASTKPMTEEQRRRRKEKLMEAIEREQARRRSNGDRP